MLPRIQVVYVMCIALLVVLSSCYAINRFGKLQCMLLGRLPEFMKSSYYATVIFANHLNSLFNWKTVIDIHSMRSLKTFSKFYEILNVKHLHLICVMRYRSGAVHNFDIRYCLRTPSLVTNKRVLADAREWAASLRMDRQWISVRASTVQMMCVRNVSVSPTTSFPARQNVAQRQCQKHAAMAEHQRLCLQLTDVVWNTFAIVSAVCFSMMV